MGEKMSLAILTSGGDAQGMNAAVRAVVRTAVNRYANVYAIYEGYEGMVRGGDYIRPMGWSDVGGILHQGGTEIGTARSAEFRTREGRRKAAKHLLERGIDRLVVIGGDGSLTGANLFRQEWPELAQELVASGEIEADTAVAHPQLMLVGMVGSIDNDMFGTDMTIGADTALHRIIEAVDALASTAASHQRSFVVEVMGRNCGYLALMSAVATGANWVFLPENPPTSDNWADEMCDLLRAGRKIGRRQNIVIVAEGARDKYGEPITGATIKQVLSERLGEDTRVTILGHVQRGGRASAFDRNLGTMMGHAAVDKLLTINPDDEPVLVGIHHNQIIFSPLMEAVRQTHQVAEEIAAHNYEEAMRLRGRSFVDMNEILSTLVRSKRREPDPSQQPLRLGIMHAGGPAPGMNTAVRVATRLGLDHGHTMLAIHNGVKGLIRQDITELNWMSVSSWVMRAGAELGTARHVPQTPAEYEQIATTLETHKLDGLLIIGGWDGYELAYQLAQRRDQYPAFHIPIVCLPASINNNLPASEYSIGADTALNTIVNYVDKIKQSAVATQRCFIVEVMGRDCGYLALMSGLATGAERVYIPEELLNLDDLQEDVSYLAREFGEGKRLGLFIRNENADHMYTTDFMVRLFSHEGQGIFDVRQAILGHAQQGDTPTPFDRIQATRMAARCMERLQLLAQNKEAVLLGAGLSEGHINFTDLSVWPELIEPGKYRPREQWWLRLRQLAQDMARENGVALS
jgi:6-phosphofructokinase 1